MRYKRIIAGAAAAAALAGGAAGALAATGGGGGEEAEHAVLSDAAKRLDVSTEELRSALAAAEDARLDAAVRAGELTPQQADAIEQRRRADGTVLRFGPGGPGHRGGHHGGPGGMLMDDAAEAIGITPEQLFQRLRNGRSLAQIARAEGKTLDDVKSAVATAATKRLDAELAAGSITRSRYDDLVEHLADHLNRLGERPRFGELHGRRGAGNRSGAPHRAPA